MLIFPSNYWSRNTHLNQRWKSSLQRKILRSRTRRNDGINNRCIKTKILIKSRDLTLIRRDRQTLDDRMRMENELFLFRANVQLVYQWKYWDYTMVIEILDLNYQYRLNVWRDFLLTTMKDFLDPKWINLSIANLLFSNSLTCATIVILNSDGIEL